MEEIKANSIYQRDLAWAQKIDSTHEKAIELIAEGFSAGYSYSIPYFNQAWLLDSLNPHIYMGFAEHAMWKHDVKNPLSIIPNIESSIKRTPLPDHVVNTHQIMPTGQTIIQQIIKA